MRRLSPNSARQLSFIKCARGRAGHTFAVRATMLCGVEIVWKGDAGGKAVLWERRRCGRGGVGKMYEEVDCLSGSRGGCLVKAGCRLLLCCDQRTFTNLAFRLPSLQLEVKG
jgi:hypothetical protein